MRGETRGLNGSTADGNPLLGYGSVARYYYTALPLRAFENELAVPFACALLYGASSLRARSMSEGAAPGRPRPRGTLSRAEPWGPVDAFLAGLGLFRSHVPGDGNCQFHSISSQCGISHVELRRLAVAHIRSNPLAFCDFIANNDLASYSSGRG